MEEGERKERTDAGRRQARENGQGMNEALVENSKMM